MVLRSSMTIGSESEQWHLLRAARTECWKKEVLSDFVSEREGKVVFLWKFWQQLKRRDLWEEMKQVSLLCLEHVLYVDCTPKSSIIKPSHSVTHENLPLGSSIAQTSFLYLEAKIFIQVIDQMTHPHSCKIGGLESKMLLESLISWIVLWPLW